MKWINTLNYYIYELRHPQAFTVIKEPGLGTTPSLLELASLHHLHEVLSVEGKSAAAPP